MLTKALLRVMLKQQQPASIVNFGSVVGAHGNTRDSAPTPLPRYSTAPALLHARVLALRRSHVFSFLSVARALSLSLPPSVSVSLSAPLAQHTHTHTLHLLCSNAAYHSFSSAQHSASAGPRVWLVSPSPKNKRIFFSQQPGCCHLVAVTKADEILHLSETLHPTPSSLS